MDLIINDLKVPLEKDGVGQYLKEASQKLNISGKDIRIVRILTKKLDIKDQNQFYYDISIVVSVPELFENKTHFSPYPEPAPDNFRSKANSKNINDRPF